MRSLLTKPLRYLHHFRECVRDSLHYLRSATVLGYRHDHYAAQRESEMARHCHSVEKCLCMPDFRPRAGESAVRSLVLLLSECRDLNGVCPRGIAAADAVLLSYRDRHEQLGIDVSDFLGAWDPPTARESPTGSFRSWQPPDAEDREAFFRIMKSRCSVRVFEPARIPDRQVIADAVELAIHSPSVCNRQTWRVHSFSGARAQELLHLQNGNRGFGHTIPLLFVVTSDMRYFTGTEERYQPWIEGGLFSMSLLLALHAQGLGAVPLNWSVLNRRDLEMHRAADIPEHERIIMLIGCGYPVEDALVPLSTRRAVEDVLIPHGSEGRADSA